MKKYKEDAYKGYMKFVKETYRDDYFKIASITWISMVSLKVEIESPFFVSTDKENKQHYRFCPKTYCVIDFSDEAKRRGAKQMVYSALCRMSKELDEIGEKVEGRA